MKKTLVVFAGKRGTTKAAAGRLAAALGGQAAYDLAAGPVPGPEDYEAVALAGAAYMGRWDERLVAWANEHADALERKEVALLEIGMNAEANAAAAALPGLAARARAYCKPGGAVRWAELGFMERLIMRMVTGKKGDASNYDEAKLDAFALELKEAWA